MRREHGRDLIESEDLLILHPVRQPLVAVGLNQRVAPGDPAAVQSDDHLPFFARSRSELLGVVGSGVPDDHLAGAVFALGNIALEGAVFQRMILGVHRQMVDRRGVGQILRHRPGHQHAVAFQAEVVVQPAGVVLLDDERIVLAGSRFRLGNRLRGLRCVAHAAVLGQPIRARGTGGQASSACSRSPSWATRASTSS